MDIKMNIQPISSLRAKKAFDIVKSMKREMGKEKKNEEEKKDENKDEKVDYLNLCKKIPSQVKVNGFSLTMANLYAKEKGNKILYHGITTWLNTQQLLEKKCGKESLEEITSAMDQKFRLMEKEASMFLIWVKSFAEGILDE